MENIEVVKSILEKNGIQMNVGGCGCCGSPSVSFLYKGELILEYVDDCNIEMFDVKKTKEDIKTEQLKRDFPIEMK